MAAAEQYAKGQQDDYSKSFLELRWIHQISSTVYLRFKLPLTDAKGAGHQKVSQGKSPFGIKDAGQLLSSSGSSPLSIIFFCILPHSTSNFQMRDTTAWPFMPFAAGFPGE